MRPLDPNAAFLLLIFGFLAIYWELLRPGRIYAGTLGAAGVVAGGYFLWRDGAAAAGMTFLAVAAILFVVEAWIDTRYVAGLLASGALAFGAIRCAVNAYLACPLALGFGATTIWLSAVAKRARQNKRADLGTFER